MTTLNKMSRLVDAYADEIEHHVVHHPSEESSLVTVMAHVLEQDLPWSFMYSYLSQFKSIIFVMTTSNSVLI